MLHEARLLDDGKFDDWLALFTPEAWYWVPSEPDQADPVETVSLIYDDRRLLGDPRAAPRQPAHVFPGAALAHQPHDRQCQHRGDGQERFATVRSKFVMIEYRREQQRLFGGTALHRLVQADGRIMIAWKRVDLVNCDAPLDGITIPF